MGDEPTNAELGRRADFLQRELATRIGNAEYVADQRTTDRRFAELGADIEDLKRQHAEDIKAVHDRLDAQAKAGTENRQHWRSLIWTGALPALVALIGVIVSLWIAHHGGGTGH